ncbi:MAG: CRISPR-associated protein Csn1, partial [Flavobacteriaceae bacterium]|nr:CRISPR-associated protein Csn1 [Flavobacteriaceae bacterium]
MKRILGLDIGTNSIGWALVEMDFDSKKGVLQGLGSRIIPMSQDELSNFDEGSPSTSSVAKRTAFRSIRKLIQRSNKRRERLHRVLNILNFLPEHYAKSIDFINHKGKFINDLEPKIAYEIDEDRKHNFIHKASYQEMIADFKSIGYQINIPYDWTLYYLRKKALYTSVKKEELAWIILNFNKKRGYYQQRGDEPENDAFKEEKLLELKIIDVKSSDSSNSKLTKYVVTLEDGHVYTKRSKLPIFSWKGETKKFIISKELDKEGKYKVKNDGSIKQTIHVVDPEKDWLAIKKKTEQDVEKSEKTLGEFIYDKLLENPMQKINGKLVSTIDRIHYKNEIKKILNVQSEYHPELRNAKIYQKCIEDLYPKNEGHRKTIIKKGFSDLIVDDILYYHRPLKSKKSTISECPYEFRTFKKGNKIQKQFLKCVPKSHPLFQEFRIWQFINNLKIIKKDEEYKQNKGDVTNTVLKTEDEYVELFEYLNNLKSINEKQILEFFVKRESLITKKNKNDYKWNYQSDKEYPCNSTR